MPTLPSTPWELEVGKAMQRCVGVFGEGEGKIIYAHASGMSYPVNGIFEAATEVVDPDTEASFLSYAPVLSLQLSLLRELPEQGDRCQIRGQNYTVIAPHFDGQGTVMLRLHAS